MVRLEMLKLVCAEVLCVIQVRITCMYNFISVSFLLKQTPHICTGPLARSAFLHTIYRTSDSRSNSPDTPSARLQSAYTRPYTIASQSGAILLYLRHVRSVPP
ncbi:hypothetical protein G7K_0593-t1 [Saitoella complicata NRRL Y-17804]|uniref:Uncharacterized protein n=1 Tax=Saitoella complicata (strain BCRC 22490 / CBS 7301 / JCM 7358 / NBRC 10748 / NRRL Y-17804) TaxID=698492 RepID=A0A0E9N908_SAICN|nr:hypothetical protein G7K_0593-t1 [Saitoella complicata NRRL Y-17804]